MAVGEIILDALQSRVVAIASFGGLTLAIIALAWRTTVHRRSVALASSLQREADAARIAVRNLTDEVDALRTERVTYMRQFTALTEALEHIDQGVLMVDRNGTVLVYNDRLAQLLDMPQALLASRPAFAKLLEFQATNQEFSRTDESLRQTMSVETVRSAPRVYERERPNGTIIEVRTQELATGEIVRTFTDITERKRTQLAIERAALRDELTGLPSRLALQTALGRAIGVAESESSQLLYLSLDRFRLLNDARGHEFGDRVLVEVARRLRSACPDRDMVSRVGGDEFAILHHGAAPSLSDDGFPDRLLHELVEPLWIDDARISITASIGVISVDAGTTAASLLRNADVALNRAKDAGRNQASRYTPSMTAARQDRFQLEQSLRATIGTDAFRLAYQPVVDVERGSVIGFESLLRWTDRVKGEVSPGVFVPVAEATGLIVPLGRSVLEWACFEAMHWPSERSVAVNLSPAQFQGDDIVRVVRDVLARSGLSPGRLELEVTEGVLLDNSETVLATMRALREIGVKLTLDDFGAGHAGLSYLRRYPFEKMKIDSSFVRSLGSDRGSDAIVEAILLLGRRLEMKVVAEGVETASQLEQLRKMHCPFVQGYLTGRPMTPEQARMLGDA